VRLRPSFLSIDDRDVAIPRQLVKPEGALAADVVADERASHAWYRIQL